MKFLLLVLILYLIFSYHQERSRKQRIVRSYSSDDPYSVLGVMETSTNEEIKAAYREQSKKNHPDLVSHMSRDFQKLAEDKLKRINAAYDIIKKQRNL